MSAAVWIVIVKKPASVVVQVMSKKDVALKTRVAQ